MATLTEALIRNYTLAKRENPKLRKGQYMQEAFPGRYKNEQSAYQTYNQTVKGRRPGKRIEPLIEPDRTILLRGKRVPRGATEEGLWKVIVHFNYVDQDGNVVEDAEISFNTFSSEHTTLLAVPYLEDAILPTAEERLDHYLEIGSPPGVTSKTITYIEVIPINTYRKPAVDLDRLYI